MGSGGSKKSAEAAAKGAEKAPEAAPAQKVDPAPAAPAVPAAPAEEGLYKPMDPPESFVVDGLKVAGGVVSDHPDVRDGKVLQVAKHPEESMMQYWLKVEYGSGQIAFVHTLMSCGWNSDKVIRGVGDAKFPPDPKNLPASTEDAPAGGMAPPPPGDDQPYKIMDPPEDFVVEGLAVNERLREDYPDVCDGKVLQVAKHPEETMMQYWLKVQYGEGKIAFVHTMMSCGWTYNNAMLDVGEAAFPPDSKSMPEGEGGEGDGEDAEPLYKLLDSPEDFVVKGLQSCGGALTGHDDVKQGKVLQVAKHPVEPRMNYWLKVEYEGKIALVHMLMSCGWTSDNLIEDVGDVAFPPDPSNLPVSKGGAVELPDLKPADYAQEFVDPSHQEAIATDPKLKSAFPEASVGDVKSIWRGPTGFWLEVVGEPERTRYGAHFLQDYDAPPPAEGEKYIINCAVRLAQDEEFPPEPRATRGKAVAFKTD